MDQAEFGGYINTGRKRFQDNKPSPNWVYAFMKRHPSLAPKSCQNNSNIHGEEKRENWYNGLSEYLKTEHGINAETFFCPDNASRIFSVDESAFPLKEIDKKLETFKQNSIKNRHRTAPDDREQISVQNCNTMVVASLRKPTRGKCSFFLLMPMALASGLPVLENTVNKYSSFRHKPASLQLL